MLPLIVFFFIWIYLEFIFQVSLENKCADIEYNSDLISDAQLAEKIEEMGFEVSINKPDIQRTSVVVKGMTCETCVRKIESNVLSYAAVSMALSVDTEYQWRLVGSYNGGFTIIC